MDEVQVRVLVVDDDPDMHALLRAVAHRHPTVELIGEARSPEEAMRLSREQPPDAILLDHNFPTAGPGEPDLSTTRLHRGMTGLEAIEFLRAAAPDAVIAVYTSAAGLAESVVHAGADMYMVKGPDPLSVLEDVAAAALRRREA